MAFTIPNKAAAGDPTQAEVFQASIDGLVGGFNRTGVATGCAVTQRGAGANMSVDVAAGTVLVVGTSVAVTAVNVAVTTADATNPRLDLVVANVSGTVSVLAGTAAAAPVEPALDATTYAVLAQVFVPAAASSVTTARITDRRVVVPAVTSMRPLTGQIWAPIGAGQAISNGINVYQQIWAVPIYIPSTITFTIIGCYVDTAVASSVVRLGIYNPTAAGQPGTLLLDAGTVSSAATGAQQATISQSLTAGLYWLTATMQAVTGARLRSFGTYASPYGLIPTDAANATAPDKQVWTVAPAVTGALPASPTWVVGNSGSAGPPIVWLKV